MIKYYFFVGEIDGEVVGFVDMERVDDMTAMITGLAVREDWRGKGIGKALTSFAVRFLKSMGFRRVRIMTLSTNAPALKIYKHLGFQRVQQTGDVVILERDL